MRVSRGWVRSTYEITAPLPKMRAGINEMGAPMRQIGAFIDDKGLKHPREGRTHPWDRHDK